MGFVTNAIWTNVRDWRAESRQRSEVLLAEIRRTNALLEALLAASGYAPPARASHAAPPASVFPAPAPEDRRWVRRGRT